MRRTRRDPAPAAATAGWGKMTMPMPRATRLTIVNMPSNSDRTAAPRDRGEQSVDGRPGRLAGRRGQPRLIPQRPQVDGGAGSAAGWARGSRSTS